MNTKERVRSHMLRSDHWNTGKHQDRLKLSVAVGALLRPCQGRPNFIVRIKQSVKNAVLLLTK